MDLVCSTKTFLATKPDFGEVTSAKIAQYLCDKVAFEGQRKPNAQKVESLLKIADDLQKAKGAKWAIQLATAQFGRATIFEDFSKLLLLCQRAKSPAELTYIAEGLAVDALRTGNVDPPSKANLQHKCGNIAMWRLAHLLCFPCVPLLT